jgi:hypothetical protein
MEQILAHLVGDYILQTDKMATLKTKSILWAVIHAAAYTLPFLLLTRHPLALIVIFGTHAIIDRYRLPKYVVAAKNAVTDWSRRAQFATATGYAETTPAWMAVWLLIIADNTMHLLINYGALRWM